MGVMATMGFVVVVKMTGCLYLAVSMTVVHCVGTNGSRNSFMAVSLLLRCLLALFFGVGVADDRTSGQGRLR
jgi:hypothetical protein